MPTEFPLALLALRLYAIWNNNPRVFLFILLMGMIIPVMNIVSCINYLLPMLTRVGQYIYISGTILALPSPLLGCGDTTRITDSVNVIATYVFLSCAQWVFDNIFAPQP